MTPLSLGISHEDVAARVRSRARARLAGTPGGPALPPAAPCAMPVQSLAPARPRLALHLWARRSGRTPRAG